MHIIFATNRGLLIRGIIGDEEIQTGKHLGGSHDVGLLAITDCPETSSLAKTTHPSEPD